MNYKNTFLLLLLTLNSTHVSLSMSTQKSSVVGNKFTSIKDGGVEFLHLHPYFLGRAGTMTATVVALFLLRSLVFGNRQKNNLEERLEKKEAKLEEIRGLLAKQEKELEIAEQGFKAKEAELAKKEGELHELKACLVEGAELRVDTDSGIGSDDADTDESISSVDEPDAKRLELEELIRNLQDQLKNKNEETDVLNQMLRGNVDREVVYSQREYSEPVQQFISFIENLSGQRQEEDNSIFDLQQSVIRPESHDDLQIYQTSQSFDSAEGGVGTLLELWRLGDINETAGEDLLQIYYLVILRNEGKVNVLEEPSVQGLIKEILNNNSGKNVAVKVLTSLDELIEFNEKLECRTHEDKLDRPIGATVIAESNRLGEIRGIINSIISTNVILMTCGGDVSYLTECIHTAKAAHFYSMLDTNLTGERKNKGTATLNFLLKLLHKKKLCMLTEEDAVALFWGNLPYCYEKVYNSTGYYTDLMLAFNLKKNSVCRAYWNSNEVNSALLESNDCDNIWQILTETLVLDIKTKAAKEIHPDLNEVDRADQAYEAVSQLANYTWSGIRERGISAINLLLAKKE